MVFLRRRRKVPLRAEDIMVMDLIKVTPDTTIAEAARIMWNRRVGSVLVVDDEGKLRGIVTERDLVFACSEAWDTREHRVYEIMSENPITVKPDDSIFTVIRKMREANVRHLPVVDEEGKPVGIISSRDVIDLILTLMGIAIGIQGEE
ncbi:MAG: CBS domain-containing protein [Desulfurococcales archaeon]|nr:CBS domain-containing protein [Desulfurococcales archaeon]